MLCILFFFLTAGLTCYSLSLWMTAFFLVVIKNVVMEYLGHPFACLADEFKDGCLVFHIEA